MRKQRILETIISLLVFIFLYASLSKLSEYQTFKFQLGRSPYIMRFADTIAWILPLGEIFVTIALVVKRMRLIGLYASLFLMVMFSAYIYAMMNYSYYVPCSCGGILSHMGWHTHLYFNLAFVGMSIAGIVIYEPDVASQKLIGTFQQYLHRISSI